MTERLLLESVTAERLLVTLTTSGDPAATAPSFMVMPDNATSPTGTWVAGTWAGAWAAGRIVAITPLIGPTQPLPIVEGQRYGLWVRWTVGGETPVRKAATLVVQ